MSVDQSELPRIKLESYPFALLAVAVYVFLAPNVDFTADLQWHDGQRIGQLALLAFTVFTLVLPSAANGLLSTWIFFPFWSRVALLGVFALGLLSSVMAPLPRWALLEWGMSWLLLILALIIAAQRSRAGIILDRWLVMLFYATASAYAVTSVIIYLTMLNIGPFFNVRELYGGFSNVRFFGHIQTMLLPFLLLPAMWWGTTLGRRVMLLLVPFVWWMLVVASGTRGTWVALVAGVVAVAIFSGASGRRWMKWQICGLVGGLLFYAVFIWAVPQLLDQPAWFIDRSDDILSLSQREVLWNNSIMFLAQNQLLGIGPMHYAYLASAVAAHPHSALLQWLTEWGIPATLMLMVILAYAGFTFALHVSRSLNAVQNGRMSVEVALLAALTGAAAQAMVDGVLVMPVSQTLLVLMCGWALGVYMEKREPLLCRQFIQRSTVLLITIMAFCAVALGVSPDINQLAERERVYLAAHLQVDPSLPRLFPRFWAQGWIGK